MLKNVKISYSNQGRILIILDFLLKKFSNAKKKYRKSENIVLIVELKVIELK